MVVMIEPIIAVGVINRKSERAKERDGESKSYCFGAVVVTDGGTQQRCCSWRLWLLEWWSEMPLRRLSLSGATKCLDYSLRGRRSEIVRLRPSAYPVNEGVAWYFPRRKGFQNRGAPPCAIGVNQQNNTHIYTTACACLGIHGRFAASICNQGERTSLHFLVLLCILLSFNI
ncbi:hypothetical protein L1887_31725 [Cichorium endivia]|nr:hypothetical protein L1887_31725 [Cichorium endivia]